MQLTPREEEKLLIFVAADVARRRRARGLRLNVPEATALITEAMLEGARDGKSVSDVMALARTILGRDDVMEHVPELITAVQVEATFPDAGFGADILREGLARNDCASTAFRASMTRLSNSGSTGDPEMRTNSPSGPVQRSIAPSRPSRSSFRRVQFPPPGADLFA